MTIEITYKDLSTRLFANDEAPETKDAIYAFINTEKVESNVFTKNETLKRVHFGKDVQTISRYAFEGCQNLETITFTHGLKTIEDFAFTECRNLRGDLIIPQSCTHIGIGAFKNAFIGNENGLLFFNLETLAFYPHDKEKRLGHHFLNCEGLDLLRLESSLSKQEELGYLIEAFVLNVIDDKEKKKYDLTL